MEYAPLVLTPVQHVGQRSFVRSWTVTTSLYKTSRGSFIMCAPTAHNALCKHGIL